jgi:hypothetical protein
MTQKVLFIASDRVKDSYGITSGLYNSASFVVSFLKEQGIEAKMVSIPDSNHIDKVVTEYNPTIVIIEALWVPPQKFEELFRFTRHSNRRWIVRIHSKAPFLSMEGLATKWIGEYTLINNGKIELAPNTKELTDQLSLVFPFGNFIYLPNIYLFKKIDDIKKIKDKEFVDVGCFGAIRPLKNIYQQALVAIEYAESIGKKLKFHINSSRLEQQGNNVLKNLIALFSFSPHELVQHGWYTHNEFLNVLGQMDICMQVSLSESFNIVTADAVSVNKPIVVSKDIDWMPFYSKATPTSHIDIYNKLMIAHYFPSIFAFIQKIYLKKYNKKAKNIWLKTINR